MSAEMVRELATLHISAAEAFAAIVVHASAVGPVAKFTVIAPGLSAGQRDVVNQHLAQIAGVLRAGMAPRA